MESGCAKVLAAEVSMHGPQVSAYYIDMYAPRMTSMVCVMWRLQRCSLQSEPLQECVNVHTHFIMTRTVHTYVGMWHACQRLYVYSASLCIRNGHGMTVGHAMGCP